MKSDLFNLVNINIGVVMPPTGRELLKLKARNGLRSLSSKVGENECKHVRSRLITPDYFVGSLTGFKRPRFNRSVEYARKVFDGVALAHRNFHDYPILVAVDCAGALKPINHDASLPVHNARKICNFRFGHGKNFRRLTSNDYPEMEYTQVGGRMRQSYLTTGRADDIVFSSWKHEAVRIHQTDGAGTNEPARKYKAYLGDDYYALAWPTTLRTFKNNLETIHQYSDTGFKLIMNGEIGRYENVRYVEQTNIVKGISTDGINGTPWVNGQSDWIFFFGNDTVAEAIAVPEEMRGKIPETIH